MSFPRRNRSVIVGVVTAGLAAALLLPVQDAAGQGDVDARWLPWLGCWTEVGSPGEMLCVRPAAGAEGMELVTVRGDEVAAIRHLRADGTARETSREGCAGTESATFSSDGHRLYLRSELHCEGGLERQGTGLVAMVSPTEWIRVETVEVAGESAAVTERYREAPDGAAQAAGLVDVTDGREMAVSSARRAAASRLNPDDLIEASRHVDTEAVRTWIAEQDEALDVNAEKLVRLADAGVAEEVIDVVVAVSFPEHFALDRDARGEGGGVAARGSPDRVRSPYVGRARPSRLFYGYYPSGYGYRLYGRWYHAPRHTRRPTVIVVQPREDGGDRGRVVNGRGYTRGRGTARDPDAAVPRQGRSSPGSATPAGARSGTSPGSTGRKAKRREDTSGSDDDSGGNGSS